MPAMRAVFVGDGERPKRMRGTATVGPSRLRIELAVEDRSRMAGGAVEFHLYQGKRFLLPFYSGFAASRGRSFPVTIKSVQLRVGRRGRARLSIDPPSPLDFTLHLYGAADALRTMLATFLAAGK